MNYKSRKITLLLFITVLFLITSFVVNASSQNIWFTNIWYKKLPNYTHLTIKASGAISEYEVSYLEAPERIIIDVKNANYSIDELVKNILFLNMGSVKQVRCGQFESEPVPITRFVVDLFQKSDYEVKLSSDSRLLYIDVYDYTEFKAPEEQIFTVTPVKSEAVKIEKEEEPKISILDIYTEPINLNVFEEDVVNVIRGLSELTGIDIMLDDSVTGQLTLNLKDKTFREAIELLMLNKGLSYTERSDTLIIAAKDIIEGYKMPVTRVYELKNASAEAAKSILDGTFPVLPSGAINHRATLYFHFLAGSIKLFGFNQFAGRSLNLIFTCLIICALYSIGRNLFGRSTGAVSAFLFAISPLAIHVAREIRMYEMTAFLSLVIIGLGYAYIDKFNKFGTHIKDFFHHKSNIIFIVLYALLWLLTFGTHLSTAAFIFSIYIYFLYSYYINKYKQYKLFIVAGIVSLPFLIMIAYKSLNIVEGFLYLIKTGLGLQRPMWASTYVPLDWHILNLTSAFSVRFC